MYEFVGKHYLASLYGVKKIKEQEFLKSCFTKAIEKSGATICGYTEHIFNDGGMTGMFLLKESHCSFHTYIDQKNIFVQKQKVVFRAGYLTFLLSVASVQRKHHV